MTDTAGIATERPFEDHEMDRRLAAVRLSMARAEVDLLLVTDPHDVYYLTAGRELGGLMQLALVVPGSGELAFAARAVDTVAFVAHTGARKIFAYRDHEPPENAIVDALRSHHVVRPRIGFQAGSPTLSIAMHDRIKALMPEARWTDTTRLVWDIAAIKSAPELEHQRRSAAINTRALDRAIAAIAEGVSDSHIASELIAGMLEAGSHPFPHFYLATGPRTAVVHATYNDRRLRADDVIHFEFTSTRFAYTAPLMRTCTLGKPNPAAKKLHDAAIGAIDAAMAVIREGVKAGTVDKAANDVLERHGVRQWHHHRTGYMVGIADPTTWALGHIGALRQDDPTILRENMTFHLPMVLFQPGVIGAGLSETVRVTKSGIEVLTGYRKELIPL